MSWPSATLLFDSRMAFRKSLVTLSRLVPHSHRFPSYFPIFSPYLLVRRGKGKWVGESTERGKGGKGRGKGGKGRGVVEKEVIVV